MPPQEIGLQFETPVHLRQAGTVAAVLCARCYHRFKLGTRPSLAALLLEIVLTCPYDVQIA